MTQTGNHCDEDVEVPESWKKKYPELYRTDKEFAQDCRGNARSIVGESIGDQT